MISSQTTPQDFIAKWSASTRNERAASQEHFIDLCHLLGQPTPNSDPTGTRYAFEKGAAKTSGGDGWADVWKRGHFGWEYKGRHRDPVAAYKQLLKYRLFAWLATTTIPDHKVHAFARDDDYFFGVLQSGVHELCSLAQCCGMGVGNDPSYSSSRTFETSPLPWPPGTEPTDDPRVEAIAEAARELVAKREAWLNPLEASVADLKQRTLTNLYNQRPSFSPRSTF